MQAVNLLKYFANKKYVRVLSTTPICSVLDNIKQNRSDWNVVVKEAEKIVGYPTSFLNLRWLLNDELANIALHLRKLVGTNHPLLKTARDLFIQNDLPSWGLVVLLVSKAAGKGVEFRVHDEIDSDISAGVLHSQRALAEITEMIRKSIIIHQGLLNFSQTDQEADALNYGNKVALLSGDYLLCKSYHELASLRNQEVNEHISSALRDLTECHFFGPRDNQNKPLPARPNVGEPGKIPNDEQGYGTSPLNTKDVLGHARAEWTVRTILEGGSLLGKACQCSFMLAGHPREKQESGYRFGKNLALAWQACIDRNEFRRTKPEKFKLVSAPVLFHIEYDPEIYREIEKGAENIQNIDYEHLYGVIMDGPGLEKTRQIQKEHARVALNMLEGFPEGDAKVALFDIIDALNE